MKTNQPTPKTITQPSATLFPSDGEMDGVRNCLHTPRIAATLKAPAPLLLALGLAAVCTVPCGCGTAKVSSRHEIAAAPTAKPAVVYVADFDLDAADIKSEKGLLPPAPKLPGPLGNLLPAPPGTPKDPTKLAHELVETLSASLVKDLTKAGLTARRWRTGEPLPNAGWLVRGVFTDVSQGNQLQRAVIGFGLGKTDLQVLVDVANLARGTPEPFYELRTSANSGKAPGAGPMIALNPAGAAARFVIAGNDLNRNAKQTAAKIADDVVQRTRQTELATHTQRQSQ